MLAGNKLLEKMDDAFITQKSVIEKQELTGIHTPKFTHRSNSFDQCHPYLFNYLNVEQIHGYTNQVEQYF